MARIFSVMMVWVGVGVFAALGGLSAFAQESGKPLYLDPAQSVEKRTWDLISRLTLEEKGILLNHNGPDIERLGIKSDKWNQCLHGVCWDRPTTMFPVSIAMAATWDPAKVHASRRRNFRRSPRHLQCLASRPRHQSAT